MQAPKPGFSGGVGRHCLASKLGLLMMDFDARNADTKARFCFEALAKIVVNNNNNNNVHLSCAH